ncbi:MAG TPA: SpoIID/LytB domain-containing protein [Bacteroidales bacterium]|nr:SpoIID/LytB domain-containing protein [Bacteroidales bacterium]
MNSETNISVKNHLKSPVFKLKTFLLVTILLTGGLSYGQIKIRLFADRKPETLFFSVTGGKYLMYDFIGDTIRLAKGDIVVISDFNGKLGVKPRNVSGFFSDSLIIEALEGDASFYLKADNSEKRFYSGDLKVVADLNTILIINSCDEEKYIEGVVIAEGGGGRNTEYFKTQAILARTYLYKYRNKHLIDGYNLCDGIHCQAYDGLCTDSVVSRATMSTKGLVILDSDKNLIISAFHSNCGGQTASSEDVWLTSVPYLRSVKDPYCVSSRNSAWQRTYNADEWMNMIHRLSHTSAEINASDIGYQQENRTTDYKAGQISIPFRNIRSELNLKSAYFSVLPDSNKILLKGRGYGHGVGLCQEGAIVMAAKGFSYMQIINFYYFGVSIADIGTAKKINNEEIR